MIHVFIVNPLVCDTGYAQKLRKELEQFPGIDTYVFSTRKQGHERELVELLCRFFDNEEIRFYCCGGSGTLRNMLSGVDDLSRVEVAMIPFGCSDFLKVFTDDQQHFRNIKSMIYGEVVYVDYIKSNLGIALNELSFGADTDTLRIGEDLKDSGFGLKHLPYGIATLYASLFGPSKSYDIVVDNMTLYAEKTTMMYFGNGSIIGGRFKVGLNEIVDDGYASYAFMPAKGPLQRISAVRACAQRNTEEFKKYARLGLTKRIKARRANGARFAVELDGELFPTTQVEAEIVRQGLKFVIPKRGV